MQKVRKDTVKRKHVKRTTHKIFITLSNPPSHIPFSWLQNFIFLIHVFYVCLLKIPSSPFHPYLNQNEWNFSWLTLEANYSRVQVQPRQMQ